MKVLVLTTWENPKPDDDLRKYYDFLNEFRNEIYEREKKFNAKSSGWSDGTGKMYNLREFESYEAYAKFYDDEETQRRMVHFFRLVNNAKTKVLRETISAPP